MVEFWLIYLSYILLISQLVCLDLTEAGDSLRSAEEQNATCDTSMTGTSEHCQHASWVEIGSLSVLG